MYAATGWHEIDGQNAYLFPGVGAVSAGGVVDVDVDFTIAPRFLLLPRDVASDPLVALGHSLRMAEVGPPAVTVPLVIAAYTAPVASFFGLNFSLVVVGRSGTCKWCQDRGSLDRA